MAKENLTKSISGDLEKRCFIIMPISDHQDYEEGHFLRVYEHIIKPACELAGFRPLRADEVKSTNLIALDIVKQIIECDMAICDLSSRNPNVLYEVGIRQAFNLPVTFIKDSKTDRIFDIQGFRDVTYSETLRIDTVEQEVSALAETIKNTFENKNEVNSLVILLGIEPAKVSTTKISRETEIILSSLKSIENRLSNVENLHGKAVQIPLIPKPEVDYDVELLTLCTFEDLINLSTGERIVHQRFGPGVLIEKKYPVTEMNDKSKLILVIKFEIGTKQLMARFSKLYR